MKTGISHQKGTHSLLEFTKILLTTGWNDVGMDNTELIDMNGSCSTSLPNYPRKLSEATGIYTNNMILICGGYNGIPINECYKVTHMKLNFFRTSLLQLMN